MSEVETNQSVIKDELYSQYNWFYSNFAPAVQNAGDEFFSNLFSFRLMSIGKNINVLSQGEDYFVTKIRLDKQHDVFLRNSSDAVNIILNRILGENKKFDLSQISELEAKIVSSFNDYVYGSVSNLLLPTPPKTQKRKNFDAINLTFFIRDNQSGDGAKMILSVPQVLLDPQAIIPQGDSFDVSDFKSSKLNVGIKVGTTKFFLRDLKNLEKEDIVIFENSNIHEMTLIFNEIQRGFKISPNPGLITSVNNDNGGHIMEEHSISQDMWDNIQVEMGAEFEKVKITLGELKNIEQGLVVDISSIYNNKVSLKVENKVIAKGELVIINDRYGVRIDEVFASDKTSAENVTAHVQPQEETFEEIAEEEQNVENEFDYSDFELDDQDI